MVGEGALYVMLSVTPGLYPWDARIPSLSNQKRVQTLLGVQAQCACMCICVGVCVYSPPWLRITDLTKPGQGLPNKYQPVSGSPQIPQGKVYQQVGLRLKSHGKTLK